MDVCNKYCEHSAFDVMDRFKHVLPWNIDK